MKNLKHQAITGGSITLALAVPAGTKSGDIVTLGTAGLYGVATVDRVTTDTINAGTAAPGYIDGQAGVYLPGIVAALNVPTLTSIADFAKVYKDASTGLLTGTATNNLFVGYRLGATTLGLHAN